VPHAKGLRGCHFSIVFWWFFEFDAAVPKP
jgi:hypothetical protein